MSNPINRANKHKSPVDMKRLSDELAEIDAGKSSAAMVDNEMLSLMVNRVLKGEDISKRYPAFYRKLLNDAGLRQAFIDALELIEIEQTHQLLPIPNSKKASLTFLTNSPTQSALEILEEHKWRTTWQRTLEQIQAIFSPPELAYRADPSLYEDSWFTLLRDEIDVEGTIYTVALECTLAGDVNAISTYLSLAVTLGTASSKPNFPLQARLQWGGYQKSVRIAEEGRAKFPDIPLNIILDDNHQSIKSGLSLTLETNV